MRDDPWDRASLDANVKPQMAVRDVSRRDLMIPRGPGTPRMLAVTFAGGVSMALLYVWPVLMIVSLASVVDLGPAGFWSIVGGAAVCFWVLLFALGVRETAADRRYAEQLHLPG